MPYEPSNKQVLLEGIKALLQSSRQNLQLSINTTMVQTYWHIGQLIVEGEQKGGVWTATVVGWMSDSVIHHF